MEHDSRNDSSREYESQVSIPSDHDNRFTFGVPGDWFSARWSCKGGDWKRTDDAQDRYCNKKLVLNNGFSLCQMPKSGCEDPRWTRKDDLYYPSHGKRLDLPLRAFCTDEKVDCSALGKPVQTKLASARGVKGNILSVVRINACVVKDHGSLISELRHKTRGKDIYHSRSSRFFSSVSDRKRLSTEEDSQLKVFNDQGSLASCRSMEFINIPKEHLCTVHDLHLHLGDWYYLDGSGRERGPSSFSGLVDRGIVKEYSRMFRKCDKLWVPVTSSAETYDVSLRRHQESSTVSGQSSGCPSKQVSGASFGQPDSKSNLFNSLYPQFVGYTRGKLHDLVMRSYKSREFAAVVNEVLDPWINARQPKKEVEKQIYWKSGEAAPKSLAQRQDMVVQQFSQIFWQPNVRSCN